jgi:hypothetical protein
MRERPILFSAPMIRALLDGRKTQTRRIAKLNDAGRVKLPGSPKNWHPDDPNAAMACPYGQPGDRLWVRETFYCDDFEYPHGPRERLKSELYYRATDCLADGRTLPGFALESFVPPWRPSIHMPRWASRITLEITDVRVERLNAISEADAIAEGLIYRPAIEAWSASSSDAWPTFRDPRRSFAGLWESINGQGSWDANPWVWAITFRRIDTKSEGA